MFLKRVGIGYFMTHEKLKVNLTMIGLYPINCSIPTKWNAFFMSYVFTLIQLKAWMKYLLFATHIFYFKTQLCFKMGNLLLAIVKITSCRFEDLCLCLKKTTFWHFSHTHSQMSLNCVVVIENPMYLLEIEACRSIDKPLILQGWFNHCDYTQWKVVNLHIYTISESLLYLLKSFSIYENTPTKTKAWKQNPFIE
jgi:hypothetical protein